MSPYPRRHGRRGDGGFTLIELLVVMVIIPLIIGGVAEALIVSFENQSATSNRVSDSVNAQLTSDYLVRDVQGASAITTFDNTVHSGPFGSSAPQVCKPTSGAGTLLVALFHPATTNGTALDVAYWLDTNGSSTEIDRYSCTLGAAPDYLSTNAALTAVATPPPGTITGSPGETISATTDITPAQFSSGATRDWVSSAAFAENSGGTISNLSAAATIIVGSTLGFSTGTTAAGITCAPSSGLTSASGCLNPPPITVETTTGPAQVSCTGFTLTSFTGCASSSTGTVTNGGFITQSTVTGVQISITEPSSAYKFNLLGVPRSSAPAFAKLGPGGPTLLTLGSAGVNPINGGGNGSCPDNFAANICVGTGGIVVDAGGSVACNGGGAPHNYIHFESGSGSVQTVLPSSSSDCNSVTIGQIPTSIPDPLKQHLPFNGCLTNNFVNSLPVGTVKTVLGTTTSTPGLYSGGLKPSGKLEPGVYVLESGVGAVTGMVTASNLDQYFYPTSSSPYYDSTMPTSSYDPGSGVLLFVPGPGPYKPSQNCFTYSAPGLAGTGGTSVSLGTTVATEIQPLDSTQSGDYFGGDTFLGGVWEWQDATNSSGTSIAGVTGKGLLYAPSSTFSLSGNSSFTTGSMIVAGLSLNGGNTLILSWS